MRITLGDRTIISLDARISELLVANRARDRTDMSVSPCSRRKCCFGSISEGTCGPPSLKFEPV